MNDREASDCVAVLVFATNGWTDDLVDAMIDLIAQRWDNPDAAREAVTSVADSWQGMGRPPWGTLHQAYQSAVRRQVMNRPALNAGPAGRVVSVAEGRQIAARAYASHCATRDPETDVHIRSGFRSCEPNAEYLDRLLGLRPAWVDEQ